MAKLEDMRDLNETEIDAVTGGEQSIVEQLMERFPFGEWIGSTFFPYGAPDDWPR
ncbi:MAG: hypothetical protein ACFE0P_13095 [Oceanicaulis sp.]